MAIRGKAGSADLRVRPTWPYHILCCAFSQWLTYGPLWQFLVYGSVGGSLLGLWALECLCWTRGGVWFVGRCFSWIDELSWTHGILYANTSPRGLVWVPPGPTPVEIVSIKPILVLMITFHLFYTGVDGVKVVLSSRQQLSRIALPSTRVLCANEPPAMMSRSWAASMYKPMQNA
jgi:hypothetical protein